MPKQVPQVPRGPRPIGPYSVATEAAGLVFISGQLGLDPVSGARAEGGVAAEAAQIMENLGLVLGDLGLGFDDVVKTTIFLADMADFAAVNVVYRGYFAGSCSGAIHGAGRGPARRIPGGDRGRRRPLTRRRSTPPPPPLRGDPGGRR